MNRVLDFASSATTGVPGIIHLYLFSTMIAYSENMGVFFLAAGIIQLFWILPTIKEWGRAWHYGRIGGTVILMIIWSMTRFPNPITGRRMPINEIGLIAETVQAISIGLAITSLILTRER